MQAAELLKHRHLQPYVLNVHLKLNSPRRNNLPCEWVGTERNNTRKIRFSEPHQVIPPVYRERRLSYGNDRTLNPSVSGAEQSYDSSTRITGSPPSNLHPRTKEFFSGSTLERTVITKNVTSKISKNQKTTEPKAATASNRKPQLTKNHELVKSLVKHLHAHTSLSCIVQFYSDAPYKAYLMYTY